MPACQGVNLRRVVGDNDSFEVVLLQDIEYAQGIPVNRNPRTEPLLTGSGTKLYRY